MQSNSNISRRKVLSTIAVGATLGLPLASRATKSDLPVPPENDGDYALARDEGFWSEVAAHYDRTTGTTNLEHGYWGKMARPVQSAYLDATRMVNAQNSFYARKYYDADAGEKQFGDSYRTRLLPWRSVREGSRIRQLSPKGRSAGDRAMEVGTL